MALLRRFNWEKDDDERKLILRAYKGMMGHAKAVSWAQKGKIRKAFEYAAQAHDGMRRKSGEPYILHPLAVARVLVEEMELDDPVSIQCALLHDVVEDTAVTLDDIEKEFGKKCRDIIDGLTKIKGAGQYDLEEVISEQAENFRKILLTISADIRVVLIKLADRLHNMRTLGSMKAVKMYKISSETLYLYAPLAHRLGLHNIKTELENLSLEHSQPDVYHEIEDRLSKIQVEEQDYINDFIGKVEEKLKAHNLKFKIKSRFKSIYSIFRKMENQGVPFEEIYDLHAVRIILKVRPGLEQADCWRAYSIISGTFRPNPKRLRDWITVPKENGYESLQVTVMGPKGRWVEVQIRTERMDSIAEKGIAAHWKYKGNGEMYEDSLNTWIGQVREILENPSLNALDAVNEFRENLQPNNLYVFTPKGKFIRVPKGSSVLDFAYKVHTNIGNEAIGAKVGGQVVSLDFELKSGDQVEVITSRKQKPKEEWLRFVKTPRAKESIKKSLRQQRKEAIEKGREMFLWKARQYKVDEDHPFMRELLVYLKFSSPEAFYYAMGMKHIDIQKIQEFIDLKKEGKELEQADIDEWEKKIRLREQQFKELGVDEDELVLTEGQEVNRYKLAKCCNPLRGDSILGILQKDVVEIHRPSCQKAISLMSHFGGGIIQARWAEGFNQVDFLASIKVVGLDKKGMLNDLINVITTQMRLDIRKVTIESMDNLFEGLFNVYIKDTGELDSLIERIKKVKNVLNASRVESDFTPFGGNRSADSDFPIEPE